MADPSTALPVLETERLRLRAPGPGDAAAMAAFVTRNRDHFAPWEPRRTAEYFTEGHWRDELERRRAQARAGTSLMLALEARDGATGSDVLGQITFSGIVRGPFQAAYLGYGLDEGAVGRGLMTEGLRAALDHVFDDLNLHRVMANYVPENERSGRLLERLGFVREGLARAYLHLDGRWKDHVLTSLTNPRWREPDGGG